MDETIVLRRLTAPFRGDLNIEGKMKSKAYLKAFALSLACGGALAGFPHASNAQLTVMQTRLKNLPAVQVLVSADSLSEDERQLVRESVELRLRQNRLEVISPLPDVPLSGTAQMTVHIARMPSPGGVPQRAYFFLIEVTQNAWLVRGNESFKITGRIWRREFLGVVGNGQPFLEVLQKNIDSTVDRFLNDYLAANPPKGR